MSDITNDTVKKIAVLSRIHIEEDEIAPTAEQLDNILNWVEQLGSVDVEGVKPSSGGIEMPLKMRNDDITDGEYADKIVKNAPISDGHFFCVPKVVE